MSEVTEHNIDTGLKKFGITQSELQVVAENSIDAGSSFLAGNATSAFASSGTGQLIGSVANVAGATTELTNVAVSIGTKCTQYIVQELTSYLATCTAAMLTIDTAAIASYTAYYYQLEMKTTIAEAKKAVLESAEKRAKEEHDKQENAEKEKPKKEASNKVKDISKSVNETLGKAADKVNSITSYISNGTQWLEKNLPKTVEKIVEDSENAMWGKVTDFEKSKQKSYESIGKLAATKMAAPIAKATVKATAKASKLVEQNKSKVLVKAKAKIQVAIFKLRGLTG